MSGARKPRNCCVISLTTPSGHIEMGRAVTGAEDPVVLYVSGGNTQVGILLNSWCDCRVHVGMHGCHARRGSRGAVRQRRQHTGVLTGCCAPCAACTRYHLYTSARPDIWGGDLNGSWQQPRHMCAHAPTKPDCIQTCRLLPTRTSATGYLGRPLIWRLATASTALRACWG